jgi:translation initiation factor 1
MAGRERRVVWSTTDGDLRKARDPKPDAARSGGRVKVRREVAGRRGKAVPRCRACRSTTPG